MAIWQVRVYSCTVKRLAANQLSWIERLLMEYMRSCLSFGQSCECFISVQKKEHIIHTQPMNICIANLELYNSSSCAYLHSKSRLHAQLHQSNIFITKPALNRTHKLSQLTLPSPQLPQINNILQSGHRRRRPIKIRARTTEGVLPSRQVGMLPEGPETVDLCVVQKEDWVAGGGKCI